MSMHLWQEEAHRTDFLRHPESPDLHFHLCLVCQNAKTFSHVGALRPLVAAPDSAKGTRGVFLKGFNRMMPFIQSNALILWNLKASPLISHFKPLLPAWFQNSFTLLAELLTSAASELRSPVC